eukprot:1578782-Lingulodinium_polyedra.AAC.1
MLRALEAMKAQGREFPLMDYKAQRSRAAKRAWASKFTLDETCAWLTIQETDHMKRKQTSVSHSGPMYIWDVAKLNGM